MLEEYVDGDKVENFERPDYATIGGAFAYTYMSALAQLDIS